MQASGKSEFRFRFIDGKCPRKMPDVDWCALVCRERAESDRINGVLSSKTDEDAVEVISDDGGNVSKLIYSLFEIT